MNLPKDHYFESAGVPIRFFDEGEGAPVVLIHGVTSSAEFWSELEVMQSLVAEGFRAIALDCRGHGRSGKPHATADYGKQMVRDVAALLDFLNIGEAHLFGYSMGAEIALRLVTEYPERVRSLIVGGSGWSGELMVETYTRIGGSLEEHGSIGPVMRWMYAESPGGPFPAPTDAEIAQFDEFFKSQDVAALVAVTQSMPEIINLSKDEVGAIRVPVLGISGENDPERHNLERMVGVAPDFTLKVIAGADHGTALVDPQFMDSVLGFLNEQRGDG